MCSFHDADGEGVDEHGRVWRWEFSLRFGPLFIGKRGNPLAVQPGVHSAAWRVFERWYTQWRESHVSATIGNDP